jgi:tRNA(Arg) A34 adenosine deaminase TadA
MQNNEELMRLAIDVARIAPESGDIPVGAIVINEEGIVIGRGFNEREANNDPTAHAEIVAIRNAASRLQKSRLDGCTLIVTLEPCAMCAGAIAQSRISRVIYGIQKLVQLDRSGMCSEILVLSLRLRWSPEYSRESVPSCSLISLKKSKFKEQVHTMD